MSMGDRIVIMNKGVVQQVGTPHQIYSRPNNLFVANFIGSPGMNFVSCNPVRRNRNIDLMLKEINTAIIIPTQIQKIIRDNKAAEKDLVLGVRPENVLMRFEKEKNLFQTEVFAIEKTGSYNIIDVKLGKEIVRVRTLPTIVPRIQDQVYLGFDMDGVNLFDKKNGHSLTE
jgi:multiple sugar transport system ATP-binding protein